MTNQSVAVITGAGCGIGRALAMEAAARGMAVAVLDIDKAQAEAVAKAIGALGVHAKAFQGDVADPVAMEAIAQQVAGEFGGVQLLFNNAGVVAGTTLEKTRPSDAQWILNVNVLGILHCVQAFLPMLRASVEAGHVTRIINTGSENSLGLPVLGPNTLYTASKHAVLGLSDGLRRDLAGSGIGVSVLCPGLVATEIFDAKRNRPDAFGGAVHTDADRAAFARDMMQRSGQVPEITAKICFAGIDADEFIIIADPSIRDFAQRRHGEVEKALDRIDARLSDLNVIRKE